MKLLTINTALNSFWSQYEPTEFSVGTLTAVHKNTLIKDAISRGASVLDTSNIKFETIVRLNKRYMNGRGLCDDVERYAEALILNKAKEITE